MAQWKVPPVRNVNPIAPYLALGDTRKDLVKEQTGLKKEISQLQKTIDAESTIASKDNESAGLLAQSTNLKSMVGLTEKTESGLVIYLDDARKGTGTIDNIAHAADLRDMVNVLWLAGAEAISINDERVVANTSIDCIVNTILINNTKTTPRFKILAIGDSFKMEKALKESVSLSDLWKRVKNDGVYLKIQSSWRITIKPFNGSFILRYAKKAAS